MREGIAYCVAVLVATLCLLAPLHLWSVGIDFQAWAILITFGITFVAASLPFLIVLTVARAASLGSALYYLACGITFGLVFGGVAAIWASSLTLEGDPDHLSLGDGFIRFLPTFLSAGIGGSVCYWVLAVRLHPNRRVRAPAPWSSQIAQ